MSSDKKEATLGRVLKYTGLFGGVQGLCVLLSILRTKLTAVLLKVGGMGLIDSYSRTTEMVGAATNFGISFSAVQHISRLHDAGNTIAINHYVRLVRSWVLLAALVGGAVMAVFAPLWSFLMFENFEHTLPFLALSPLVMFSTISGGEMAVLKGLRSLKSIAFISALISFTTLIITAIFYWQLGLSGIIPALVISSGVACFCHWSAARKKVRYEVCLNSWRFLRRGLRMVRMGLAYALSGFVATGGEVLVRSFLYRFSDQVGLPGEEAVGIYAAGFSLIISYARLLLSSLDADYYPRLSAASTDVSRQNVAVNRQIDVLVLLMAPFLMLYCLLLPFVLRILYTSDFVAAIPMALAASFYMFFKAVSTPIAYLALAHARSRMYLIVESSHVLVFVLSATLGFYWGGFRGAGLGLSLSYVIYFFTVWLVYGRAFGFRFEAATLHRVGWQFLLLLGAIVSLSYLPEAYDHWAAILFFLLSATLSWRLLTRHVHLPERFRRFLGKGKSEEE